MRVFYIFITLLIVSCTSENQNNTSQIKKVLTDQEKAWNDGNLEGYMAGYIKSDSLRFASGGNVSYGWQTTFDRYKKGYPDKAIMGILTFSNIDIELISPDAAIVFGKWELDRKSDHPCGLFTLVFKKTNDGWKIIHDHTSAAD